MNEIVFFFFFNYSHKLEYNHIHLLVTLHTPVLQLFNILFFEIQLSFNIIGPNHNNVHINHLNHNLITQSYCNY